MPLISAIDNENDRLNRNENKLTNKGKKQGGREAIVKDWELNDFVVYLS